MAPRYRFALTSAHIKKALTELADRHAHVAMSLEQVGYPSERRQPHGFEPLARIVVGQQVSTKAAESIAEKLRLTLGGTISAEAVLSTETDTLRSAGLSGQKASYIQTLAEAVVTNTLDLEALPRLNDDDALKQLRDHVPRLADSLKIGNDEEIRFWQDIVDAKLLCRTGAVAAV